GTERSTSTASTAAWPRFRSRRARRRFSSNLDTLLIRSRRGGAESRAGSGTDRLVAAHAALPRSGRARRSEPVGVRLPALRPPRAEPAPFAPRPAAELR